MTNNLSKRAFRSALGPLMEEFLSEKRACGYSYDEPNRCLRRLDIFLVKEGLMSAELPQSLVKKWVSKSDHESPRTQQGRITVVRQFATFLCWRGYSAYVPDGTLGARRSSDYVPRILNRDEMRKLLHAADQLVPTARSPLRHLVMPEILRLLYGCGLRLGEVLHLRIQDVDLNQGVLTVRQGKFRKDRLVPMASTLVLRLKKYTDHLENRSRDAIFFPAPSGGSYKLRAVYSLFRALLVQCHIPHGGRGKGPRVHDLRHTFAVHTLLRWCRESETLDAKLPLLSTYLGHQNLSGTQRYLHLTAELFPEVMRRVEAAFGDVIPGRADA
jgi:site-specific recombinase XerD